MTRTLLTALLLLLVSSCSSRHDSAPVEATYTGAYYWRTTLQLSPKEREWMQAQHIQRVYLRLFDVVMHNGKAEPNATLQFPDTTAHATIPADVEIVPIVFVVEEVFRHTHDADIDSLAVRMARRISQMGETRKFKFKEVQIDCDWTRATRTPYFLFLTALRRSLPGVSLTATIRLHQLQQEAPPVDEGVLMVYNTGNYRSAKSDRNPILDYRDVKPYLRHVAAYSLPLRAAYPNFGWNILFSGDTFQGILYGVDLSDASNFQPSAEAAPSSSVGLRLYDVVSARDIVMSMGGSTIHVVPGQKVYEWRVDPADLARVRAALEQKRPGINAEAVVYHIDETWLE